MRHLKSFCHCNRYTGSECCSGCQAGAYFKWRRLNFRPYGWSFYKYSKWNFCVYLFVYSSGHANRLLGFHVIPLEIIYLHTYTTDCWFVRKCLWLWVANDLVKWYTYIYIYIYVNMYNISIYILYISLKLWAALCTFCSNNFHYYQNFSPFCVYLYAFSMYYVCICL